MRAGHRRRALLLSLSAMLAIPACSGNAADVVVAVAAPSGSFEHIRSQVQNGARLAADDLNRRGSVDGRRVRVAMVEGADPASQRSRITAVLRRDSPAALVTFENLLAVNDGHPAKRQEVPVVSIGGSFPGSKADFLMGSRVRDEAEALAGWLVRERGLTKVAIARGDTDRWEREGAEVIRSSVQRAGATVAAEVELTEGVDVLQPAQALRAAGAEAVVIWSAPAAAARLTLAVRSLAWDVQLAGGSSLLDPSFRSLAGEATGGFAIVTPAISEEAWLSDRLTGWFLDYHERFTILPIEDQSTLVAALPYAAVQAYDAVQLVASAIAEADSADPERVMAAISKKDQHAGVMSRYSAAEAHRIGRFFNLALVYDASQNSDAVRSAAFYKAQVSGFYVPERYLDTEEGQLLVERVLEQVLTDPEGVEFFRQYSPPRPPPGPL